MVLLDDGRLISYDHDRRVGNVPCHREELPASECRIVVYDHAGMLLKICPIDDEI